MGTICRYLLGFCLIMTILLSQSTSPVKGQVVQSGSVTVAIDSGSFRTTGGDPATCTGVPVIAQTIFEGLVHLKYNRQHGPAIGTHYVIGTGWKYIDFFLRDDVKFHDGLPVTAEDIKFSLETYMREDLKFLFGPIWRRSIKEIEIISPVQIRIHMSQADWGFINRLWYAGRIMPKAYRERVGDEGFAKKPIGAGPFKWVDYKQDEWIKVEAVQKHYRKTPAFKELKIVYVPDHSTRFAMLKAGEVDIVPLHAPHVPLVKDDRDLRLHWVRFAMGVILYYADLVAPEEPSPFHDIRVRKAVSLAIDREMICEKILFGTAEPWGDVLPPITQGYDETLKPEPYDPEMSKKLLAEAGFSKGFSTTMHVMAQNKLLAEALAANLANVGIRTNVEVWEIGSYYGNYFPRKFRGLIPYAGWVAPEFQAPSQLSDFYMQGMPHAYVTTPEINKAIQDGMWSETDKELAKWGRELSKLVRESRVSSFLWASHSPYGLAPKIKFWQPTMGGNPACEWETIELQ